MNTAGIKIWELTEMIVGALHNEHVKYADPGAQGWW